MKISGRRADAFVERPDPSCRVILLFGPDAGQVSERASKIVAALVSDPGDPFAVAELSGASGASDPARLVDEARAMPFGGGNRVVRVRGATDGYAAALEPLLADPPDNGWVVMESGELTPRSSLRQTCEKANGAAAIGCYPDEDAGLEAVIVQGLRDHGLKTDPDAAAFLASHMGGDRLAIRGEIEKLALYVGPDASTVRLDDAVAIVGDSAPAAMDRLIEAVAGGDARGLESALPRVFETGTNPVSVLRAMTTHFRRLHVAAGMVTAGSSADQAIKALRPPVIFKQTAAFKRQLGNWPEARLARAMDVLVEAEVACKSAGMPQETVCARALMRVTQAGRRPTGR